MHHVILEYDQPAPSSSSLSRGLSTTTPEGRPPTHPMGFKQTRALQRARLTSDEFARVREEEEAGLVRIHSNPLIRSVTSVPLTEVEHGDGQTSTSPLRDTETTEADAVATIAQIQAALEWDSHPSNSLPVPTHIAILDDGIGKNELLEKLKQFGINTPQFAPELCSLPDLPAPFQRRDKTHGGMCAFDACIFASNAVLLDFPINQPQEGCRIIEAVHAVEHLARLLRAGRLERLVVLNSWHPDESDTDLGISTDDIRHVFNVALRELDDAGADILFAVPSHHVNRSIRGPASHPSVLSVTAVKLDLSLFPNAARGPGTMGVSKPDVSNYTHFNGFGLYDGPDSSTSAATALTSGVIAELRSRGYRGTPDEFRRVLRDTARQLGDQLSFGFGLINPVAFQAEN